MTGEWRYFKFDDQKESLHFGKYSIEKLQSLDQKNVGERTLTDSELQQRFVDGQIIPFIPSQGVKDKFRSVIDAIRNKKTISFKFSRTQNKQITCSGEPLGLWNEYGNCKIVLFNPTSKRVTSYPLSFSNDIIASGRVRKMSQLDAVRMLEEHCRGGFLSQKKESVDLLLVEKAELAFYDSEIDGAENYQFDWLDKGKMIARVQFKSSINSALVEQVLALGCNVNVLGSEVFKAYLKSQTETKIEILDALRCSDS